MSRRKRTAALLVLILSAGFPSVLQAMQCRFYLNTQPTLELEGSFLYARGQLSAARDPLYDDSAWASIRVPFRWIDTLGSYRGELWLRCHIQLNGPRPESAALRLSDVSDADEVYWNGNRIGHTGSINPLQPVFDQERLYPVPAALWQEDNVLAIRVYGSSALSGIHSAPVLLRDAAVTSFFNPGTFSLSTDGVNRIQGLALGLSSLYLFSAIFFLVRGLVTANLRENLFLSAFCFLMGFYLQIQDGYRYEYFAQFTTSFAAQLVLMLPIPLLFCEYLLARAEKVRPRSLLLLEILVALVLAATVVIPMFPVHRITTILLAARYLHLIFLAMGILAVFLLIRRLTREQMTDLRYPSYGFLFLLPLLMHDIFASVGLSGSPPLLAFGFPVFLAVCALQLGRGTTTADLPEHSRSAEQKLVERRKTEALLEVSRKFEHHLKGLRSALGRPLRNEKQLLQHRNALQRFLNDAKLLASLEDDLYEIHQARFSIPEQARDVLAEVQAVTGEKPSRFKLDIPLEQDRFWSDLELFRACLYHIIENAVLHSTGKIQIRAEVRSANLYVSIRDEGPGIPAEQQDRIFDKFYRGPGLKPPGSGIGLTIVDLAVQQLGGQLHTESGPGFFTVFEMEIPEMQEAKV